MSLIFLPFSYIIVSSGHPLENMSEIARTGVVAVPQARAAVIPKFDMHVHTSKLSQQELDDIIVTYNIPAELHPILPDPNLTMNELPADKIGIYTLQLDIGGIRVPFSKFLLTVIKHFKVHISQLVPIGLNRVTLFEVRCYSLDSQPTVSLFLVFYRLCKQ